VKDKIEYFCPKCKKIVKKFYGASMTAAPAPLRSWTGGGVGDKQFLCFKCDTPLVKLKRTKKKIKI